MGKHKWNNPHEWLLEYTKDLDRDQLLNVIDILSGYVDGDEIQEYFQSDMENDGYFE